MEKRWKLVDADPVKTTSLQEALHISPVLCRILAQRGIDNFESARSFFRPKLEDLHDPFLMKDMEKAVQRIFAAVGRREKILIFGDYDVDGTTAVACLLQFLRKQYDQELVDFYIPHRHREGYGVSKAGIDFAKSNDFPLIVAVDCGIKSIDLISYAAALSIDFIVCDHHLPDATLPPAIAILNPKQKDCFYPCKDLCGCGVAFKLITALSMKLGLPASAYQEYLDLAAIAIAADIVPMIGENRLLTFFGLQKVNEQPNYGIRALIGISKLKAPVNITSLVFMIAPRINAAGRMDDARKAVRLFIAGSYEEALQYAEMLHLDNSDRREADGSITEEALGMIEGNELLVNRKSTVVFQPHWHKGVVGIVASRLIERYYRPTIVLTRSGDLVSGSARSVQGFNLYEAIHACREHLIGYGGHFAAAGMTMEAGQVDLFSTKFEEVVSSTIEPQQLVPEILIDSPVQFKDLTPVFYKVLRQMEPFGPENLRPVFIAEGVADSGYSRILKEQHIRFQLQQQGYSFTGIGFGMADKFPLLENGRPVDIVFNLDENEWNGTKTLQLKVIDLRASAV
jgi:single-stranded-DNA-specific exonuclease